MSNNKTIDLTASPPLLATQVIDLTLDDDDIQILHNETIVHPVIQELENTINPLKTKKKRIKKVNTEPEPTKSTDPPPSPAVSIRCAICLDSFTSKPLSSTNCGHIFCVECIGQHMKTKKECPTCRKKLTHNQVHRLYL